MSHEMLKWLQCVFTPRDVKCLFIDDALNYSVIKILTQVANLSGIVSETQFQCSISFKNYWRKCQRGNKTKWSYTAQ